jgi:FAD/FMN-containing dehydrogenase/Fe-S oxidoreductase
MQGAQGLAEKLEELGERLRGKLAHDPLIRSVYATGACLYRVEPLAIVWPDGVRDILEVVEFARANGIPIIARGGGTSRTGNELGRGIVLDFSKYMNKILELDLQGRKVTVEPGIVLSELNHFLKSHGLFFPPDPSTKDHCTIGGMIANNSSGPMSVKYGTTRAYVESVEVVLANGEIMVTGPFPPGEPRGREGSRERHIYGEILRILESYKDAMARERPFCTKDSSGYHLWGVMCCDGSVDLTPLIVGSEGTLGIVTKATLRLMPILPSRLSGLVYFEDVSTVGEATQLILQYGPSMVEIMERRILELARERFPSLKPHIPDGTEAILVVEIEGERECDLESPFHEMGERLVEEGLAREVRIAQSPQEAALFAKMRSISGPILNTMRGSRKPRAFIEDPAVHPSRLPEYIRGLREIFQKYGVEAAIYGHAGDGNLHSMVMIDLSEPEAVALMEAISREVYDLVLRLKGTISGEHGDGRLRSQFLPKQYPELYGAFVEIKRAFDPENIFNPGMIVGAEEGLLTKDLRFRRAKAPEGRWDQVEEELEQCSGCGKCRSYCPVARTTKEEFASARAKMALTRRILDGEGVMPTTSWKRFKELMDLCINCKRCLRECPSGVDTPWVALRGRIRALNMTYRPLAEKILTNTQLLCQVGSLFAPLSNLALRAEGARALMEKVIGLDRERKLPPFSRKTARMLLASKAMRAREKKSKVALFLSCQSNFGDPRAEAWAAVALLERFGFQVMLPKVRCCSMATINSGDLRRARKDMIFNLEKLEPIARDGIPILFTEPTCLLAFKSEYPRIIEEERSRIVAQFCEDIHEFLLKMVEAGRGTPSRVRKTGPKVGYHSPCHLRALGEGDAPAKLLEATGKVQLVRLRDLCCGMGGTFGLKKKNSRLSRQMGMEMAKGIRESDVSIVASSCAACRMQIEELAGVKTVHPLVLLERIYER